MSIMWNPPGASVTVPPAGTAIRSTGIIPVMPPEDALVVRWSSIDAAAGVEALTRASSRPVALVMTTYAAVGLPIPVDGRTHAPVIDGAPAADVQAARRSARPIARLREAWPRSARRRLNRMRHSRWRDHPEGAGIIVRSVGPSGP
jgi:hypothetical protein